MAPSTFDILKQCESRLSGVDSPRLSAELLVAHVFGCSRLDLTINRDREPSQKELEEIESLVSRRESGEPIAYILGQKEFYGLDFRLTSDVLIPRPETEHIVEEVENLFTKDSAFTFVDFGTGSGILPVTICSLFQKAHGVAVDISERALLVARNNAECHSVADRLEFLLGDFTKPLFTKGKFDLVVTNPPYVTEDEFDAASHEVTEFEPTGALVSGADGLDHIRAMVPHIFDVLLEGGYMLMEIGCGQGEAVKKITLEHFGRFGEVRVIKDLAGHDRVIFARKL